MQDVTTVLTATTAVTEVTARNLTVHVATAIAEATARSLLLVVIAVMTAMIEATARSLTALVVIVTVIAVMTAMIEVIVHSLTAHVVIATATTVVLHRAVTDSMPVQSVHRLIATHLTVTAVLCQKIPKAIKTVNAKKAASVRRIKAKTAAALVSQQATANAEPANHQVTTMPAVLAKKTAKAHHAVMGTRLPVVIQALMVVAIAVIALASQYNCPI